MLNSAGKSHTETLILPYLGKYTWTGKPSIDSQQNDRYQTDDDAD